MSGICYKALIDDLRRVSKNIDDLVCDPESPAKPSYPVSLELLLILSALLSNAADGIEELGKFIGKMPDVVSCESCKYSQETGLEYLCDKHSGHKDVLGEDSSYQEYHSGDWYCADGKRPDEPEPA